MSVAVYLVNVRRIGFLLVIVVGWFVVVVAANDANYTHPSALG
jgi:hypothetical protein